MGTTKVKVALPKAVIALVMAVASVAGLSACTSPSLWFKSDDQKIEIILNSKSVKDKLASTNKRFQNRISVSLSHEGKTIIYTLKRQIVLCLAAALRHGGYAGKTAVNAG